MAIQYPWYEAVEGENLEQGDILAGCPVFVPAADIAFPVQAGLIPGEMLTTDVVVMTQSCDLANEKIADVILCPHWDLARAAQSDTGLARRAAHEEILKGRRPRYTMLAASDVPDLPMGVRIADFGHIFSLPKRYVTSASLRQVWDRGCACALHIGSICPKPSPVSSCE